MIGVIILLIVILTAILVFGLYMLYIGNEIQERNDKIYEILKKSVEDMDRHVYYFTRDIKK